MLILWLVHSVLGEAAFWQGDNYAALDYFERSIEHARRMTGNITLRHTLPLIALTHSALGNLEQVREHLRMTLALKRNDDGDTVAVGYFMTMLAAIHYAFALGEIETAYIIAYIAQHHPLTNTEARTQAKMLLDNQPYPVAGTALQLRADLQAREILEAASAPDADPLPVFFIEKLLAIAIPSAQVRKVKRTSITPREMQVLRLLGKGKSTNEIATELNITPGTTRNHINRVLNKLDVRNRLEAVTVARALGLID